MEIVEQSAKLMWATPNMLESIEMASRTCYKSEAKIDIGSAEKLVKMLVDKGHEAMLEHASVQVKCLTDRGITHEIVRHRLFSFAQESTRYVKYKNGIRIVAPIGIEGDAKSLWYHACELAEVYYDQMIKAGAQPQVARDVLPTCTASEIVITGNIREWRHFFNLRLHGKTGAPHPKMKQLAQLIYDQMKPVCGILI